jgi:hypothetical protein
MTEKRPKRPGKQYPAPDFDPTGVPDGTCVVRVTISDDEETKARMKRLVEILCDILLRAEAEGLTKKYEEE